MGDFIVPGYDWVKSDNFSVMYGFHDNIEVRTAVSYYSNLCSNYCLAQFNVLKNSSNNILDLVVSNISKISVVAALEAIFDCDELHHALDIVLPNFSCSKLNTVDYYLTLKMVTMKSFLNSYWIRPFFYLLNFGDSSIDVHTSQFQIFLSNIINHYVTKLAIKAGRFPRWFSTDLIVVIIRKKNSINYLKCIIPLFIIIYLKLKGPYVVN